jgi:hypothetical protein
MSICYLCGVELQGNATDDHVPPKGLFAPNTPQVTVPCCLPCNKSYAVLDEEIRNQLSFISAEVPTPVQSKTMRSLALRPDDDERIYRIRKLKFEKLALRNVVVDNRERFLITLDQQKLDRWMSRIVKGLYFHERRQRLPDSATFVTTPIYDAEPPSWMFHDLDDERSRVFWFDLLPASLQMEYAPDAETWMFIFYKKLLIITDVRYSTSEFGT